MELAGLPSRARGVAPLAHTKHEGVMVPEVYEENLVGVNVFMSKYACPSTAVKAWAES